MFDLASKTSVVTGGGRGIGRGIARAMARAGANVLISGRTELPLRETQRELADLGVRAGYLVGDITSAVDLDRLVAAALDLGDGTAGLLGEQCGKRAACRCGTTYGIERGAVGCRGGRQS